MKLLTRFQLAFAFLMGICLIAPLTLKATTVLDQCSKELMTYFPEELIDKTLSKFSVPQNKWPAIKAGLKEKDTLIVKFVESKAAHMKPNPLKNPQQRQVAITLFKETLLETFTEVMHKNEIFDKKQIQAMLDDIQQQKARKLASCIEKYRHKTSQENPKDSF